MSNVDSSAVVSVAMSSTAPGVITLMTETSLEAVMPSPNATIVALPSDTPVTMPSDVTVAISSLRLYHLIWTGGPYAGTTEAVNVTDCEMSTDTFSSEMSI